ncbi:MAG: thioredoxin-like domain-containing protein [Paludibacter sp.]
MKKLIYFAAIIAITFACKPTTYKIEGTVNQPELNGKFIFIKERINRVWTTIDSVKIENQKFAFNGVCDSARVVFIEVEKTDGESLREPFVFENGEIKIHIDKSGVTAGGTEQNEVLQKYLIQKNSYYAKAEEVYKSFNDSTATDAEKAAIDAKMAEFEKIITENDIQFATDHANSIVGNYVFGSSFYGMTIEQKEKIVQLMTPQTKAIPRMAEIIAAIDVEKQTSKGQKYTEIELPDMQGEKLALSSLIGKTDFVLVDFWASWCGPCMKSLPELKALYAKHKGAKLEILGVSLDDDTLAWKETVNKQKINWKHISDLQGWKNAGAGLYAVRSIPATVLIDRNGVIVGRNLKLSEIEQFLNTAKK